MLQMGRRHCIGIDACNIKEIPRHTHPLYRLRIPPDTTSHFSFSLLTVSLVIIFCEMLLDAMKRRSEGQIKPRTILRKQAWSASSPELSRAAITSPTWSEKIQQVDFRPMASQDNDYDMISDMEEDVTPSMHSDHAVSQDDLSSLMKTLDQSIFESTIQMHQTGDEQLSEKEWEAMIKAGVALYADTKAKHRLTQHKMASSHKLQIDLLTEVAAQDATFEFDPSKYAILMELAKQRLFVKEADSVLVNPMAQTKVLKYWNDHFDGETLLAMLEVPGIFESIYNHTLHHAIGQ